jgi:hypothetical protein
MSQAQKYGFRLKPRTGYWLDAEDGLPWLDKSIPANRFTRPEKALGYITKTIEFISSVAGTLNVFYDLVGDGDFKLFITKSVSANTPINFILYESVAYIKLNFNTAGVVRAKFNFI